MLSKLGREENEIVKRLELSERKVCIDLPRYSVDAEEVVFVTWEIIVSSTEQVDRECGEGQESWHTGHISNLYNDVG